MPTDLALLFINPADLAVQTLVRLDVPIIEGNKDHQKWRCRTGLCATR